MFVLDAVRWVRAEVAPVGVLVADRPEIGALVEVRPAGAVHGVPMVVLVGADGAAPPVPADALVGLAG